jgi:hypothetical protein
MKRYFLGIIIVLLGDATPQTQRIADLANCELGHILSFNAN